MGDDEKKEKKKKTKKKADSDAPAEEVKLEVRLPPPPGRAKASSPVLEEAPAPPPADAPPVVRLPPPPGKIKVSSSVVEESPAPPAADAPPVVRLPPPPRAAPPPEEAPPEEPNISVSLPPPEKKPVAKRKANRCGSNVFAMFTQRKVQEFKEAFQLIDQDKDGFITKSDLKLTFDLLVTPYSISGREVEDEDLEAMLAEAPGPLNFTMFLTIFGERISGTDEEEIILPAFSIFDEGDGKMKEEVLKSTLRKRGDKFTEEEADICLKEAPVDREGYINIRRFTKILTKGDDEEDMDGGYG